MNEHYVYTALQDSVLAGWAGGAGSVNTGRWGRRVAV